MCFKIIINVTKYQGFTLSLEDIFFKKPQREGQIDPLPPCRFRVNVIFIRLDLIFMKAVNETRTSEIMLYVLSIFMLVPKKRVTVVTLVRYFSFGVLFLLLVMSNKSTFWVFTKVIVIIMSEASGAVNKNVYRQVILSPLILI